jgi:hypothetical protein
MTPLQDHIAGVSPPFPHRVLQVAIRIDVVVFLGRNAANWSSGRW